MHGQTQHYVAALLERGVRVLAYAGSYDFLCNWAGIRDWTLNLEWSGQEEFGQEELREWTVNGRKAGVVRMFGGFAFATIDGGGHMVYVVFVNSSARVLSFFFFNRHLMINRKKVWCSSSVGLRSRTFNNTKSPQSR